MADSWSEWGKHVLCELERLDTEREGLRKEVDKNKRDIAILQVKAGIWGAFGGLGVAIITGLIAFLSR